MAARHQTNATSRVKASSTSAVYEDGIECTPDSMFKGLAGCCGFILSLVVVVSLGITAGGVFWSAQSISKLTDGTHRILVKNET